MCEDYLFQQILIIRYINICNSYKSKLIVGINDAGFTKEFFNSLKSNCMKWLLSDHSFYVFKTIITKALCNGEL